MIINTKKGGGVTPTGSLSITANGTYDVTNYASAAVNVSGSLSSNWVSFRKETVTVGANTITQCEEFKAYIAGLVSLTTHEYVVAINMLPKTNYVYNDIGLCVLGEVSGTPTGETFRYRNGWSSIGIGNFQYDAVANVGDQFDVIIATCTTPS